MLARAKGKFIRGAASKIRQVIDLIRGMNAQEALAYLKFIDKRPTYYIGKVLASAIANARIKGLSVDDLVISKITADEGPRWKRFRAVAFGRAAEILKRTSHITVELDLQKEKRMPVVSVEEKPAKKARHEPSGKKIAEKPKKK